MTGIYDGSIVVGMTTPFDYGDPFIEWNEENDYVDEAEQYDYEDGMDTAAADLAANYWNPIDQGFYDDDPNPYHGDYSEM